MDRYNRARKYPGAGSRKYPGASSVCVAFVRNSDVCNIFFVKGRKVEILSPTTIIKGTPVSFEDAEGFCTFLSEILRPDYKVKFNGS